MASRAVSGDDDVASGGWVRMTTDQAVMIVTYMRYGREESNMVGLAAENSLTCAD